MLQRRRRPRVSGPSARVALEFQLSFAEPLLLGESAFRVALEAGRRRGDRSLERRPFDQQRHRFGQVLARGLRIGAFREEGKAGVVRRRREGARRRIWGGPAGFKRLDAVEQRVDRRAPGRLRRAARPSSGLGMARDLVGMAGEAGEHRVGEAVARSPCVSWRSSAVPGERADGQLAPALALPLRGANSRGGKAKAENRSSNSRL